MMFDFDEYDLLTIFVVSVVVMFAASEIGRLLATDLNVPAAIDLAIETGGGPARMLTTVLGLS